MRRKEVKLQFGKKKISTVLSTSCWHYGNPSVSQEGIHNFIKKAKKHLWIHHGDVVEGITRSDRRFSQDEHKESLLYAAQQASATMSKASDTCIGLIKGNHDEAPSREMGDLAEHIAINGKVPFLSATCYLKFIAPKGKATGFFAHGTGSSNPRSGDPERKQINRQIWLRNQMSQFEADICGMGHTHRFTVTPPCSEEKLCWGDKDNVGRKPIKVKPTWYYTAPSMFTTYDLHADTSNYAEMALYGATDIGWIETDFDETADIKCIREVYSTGETKQAWYPRIVG